VLYKLIIDTDTDTDKQSDIPKNITLFISRDKYYCHYLIIIIEK